MNAFLAFLKIDLKLARRNRAVLFFNYFFPLMFFFVFGYAFDAKQGSTSVIVVTMVTTIDILGSGFFGAGMRAVLISNSDVPAFEAAAPDAVITRLAELLGHIDRW